MDPEFKKTFIQGWQGSYWIYTDSLETFYDTVTLVYAGKGIGDVYADYHGEGYSTQYEATNCLNFFTRMSTRRYKYSDTEEVVYTFDFDTNTGAEYSVTLRNGEYRPFREGGMQKLDSVSLLGKTYYNVTKLIGGINYREVIIDPEIGIIYKDAAAKRPEPAGRKNST